MTHRCADSIFILIVHCNYRLVNDIVTALLVLLGCFLLLQVLIQHLVQLRHKVIVLCQEEVGSYGLAQVVLADEVSGFGIGSVLSCGNEPLVSVVQLPLLLKCYKINYRKKDVKSSRTNIAIYTH